MNTSNDTRETITIQLTRGQATLVSAIDADLAQYKWHALAMRVGFHAVRHQPGANRVMVRLHRVILERIIGRTLTRTELTDHIDGNPLNKCRTNLRIATNAENQRNRGKTRANTSGFKGVYWERLIGKWRAQIVTNGKQIRLGSFDTPEAAHEAYCIAAREFHGEFANTGTGKE